MNLASTVLSRRQVLTGIAVATAATTVISVNGSGSQPAAAAPALQADPPSYASIVGLL